MSVVFFQQALELIAQLLTKAKCNFLFYCYLYKSTYVGKYILKNSLKVISRDNNSSIPQHIIWILKVWNLLLCWLITFGMFTVFWRFLLIFKNSAEENG